MTHPKLWTSRIGDLLLLMAIVVAAGFNTGCASSMRSTNQRIFSTPTEAVDQMLTAVRQKDDKALISIFGPDSKELLSSGDPVDDQRQREVLLAAAGQKWSLLDKGTAEKELIVGDEEWPFPIPLVKEDAGWRFDTDAGTREVFARRIGRNELAAIRLFDIYVEAQRSYAAASRDGQPAGTFAQKFKSDAGKHNGLYWPIAPGEPPSPFGALASRATAEGYARPGAAFHGYFFKILTSQGPDAPGGARNFIQDGKMTGGFGLLAYPADYGNSGIMTFMVNQEGNVLQADLGEATAKTAASISAYNPDSRWKPAR